VRGAFDNCIRPFGPGEIGTMQRRLGIYNHCIDGCAQYGAVNGINVRNESALHEGPANLLDQSSDFRIRLVVFHANAMRRPLMACHTAILYGNGKLAHHCAILPLFDKQRTVLTFYYLPSLLMHIRGKHNINTRDGIDQF